MIMSYLLSRIFPWVVELGLWLTMVCGGVMGYQSEFLDSRILASLLGAGIGFVVGVFPFGLLQVLVRNNHCLLYTSPSPRDATLSRMPSSA